MYKNLSPAVDETIFKKLLKLKGKAAVVFFMFSNTVFKKQKLQSFDVAVLDRYFLCNCCSNLKGVICVLATAAASVL